MKTKIRLFDVHFCVFRLKNKIYISESIIFIKGNFYVFLNQLILKMYKIYAHLSIVNQKIV